MSDIKELGLPTKANQEVIKQGLEEVKTTVQGIGVVLQDGTSVIEGEKGKKFKPKVITNPGFSLFKDLPHTSTEGAYVLDYRSIYYTDGEYIIYTLTVGDSYNIYLKDLKTGESSLINLGLSYVQTTKTSLRFVRGGDYIYFPTRANSTTMNLMRLNLLTKELNSLGINLSYTAGNTSYPTEDVALYIQGDLLLIHYYNITSNSSNAAGGAVSIYRLSDSGDLTGPLVNIYTPIISGGTSTLYFLLGSLVTFDDYFLITLRQTTQYYYIKFGYDGTKIAHSTATYIPDYKNHVKIGYYLLIETGFGYLGSVDTRTLSISNTPKYSNGAVTPFALFKEGNKLYHVFRYNKSVTLSPNMLLHSHLFITEFTFDESTNVFDITNTKYTGISNNISVFGNFRLGESKILCEVPEGITLGLEGFPVGSILVFDLFKEELIYEEVTE